MPVVVEDLPAPDDLLVAGPHRFFLYQPTGRAVTSRDRWRPDAERVVRNGAVEASKALVADRVLTGRFGRATSSSRGALTVRDPCGRGASKPPSSGRASPGI